MLKGKGPHLFLVGAYKISGRVLILPIQGEGASNITLGMLWKTIYVRKFSIQITFEIIAVDPELNVNFDGRSFKRNGKEYMKIENLSLTFTISRYLNNAAPNLTTKLILLFQIFYFFRMHFDFKNLYNGDKLLGDSTNLFLNENWQDIFNEIKGSIFDAFSLIAQSTLTNIFNKVPYKDLFSEY